MVPMYHNNFLKSTFLNEYFSKHVLLQIIEELKLNVLKQEQILNLNIDDAWNFFSNPANLNEITPPDMKFKILTDLNGKMYSGQIIEYEIELLPNINQRWVTEIKNVKEKEYFIDEQRFGPYRFWYHEHKFEDENGKVKMTDTVHYDLPLGFIGKIAHSLYVKKKLKQIFNYRYQLLEDKFA